MLNALIVGDEKFENLTDAEHQMQLLCGIGLMNGTMGVVRTASFSNGYRKAKKAYDKANLDAERMIGKAEWDALRNKIDLADNDELVQTLVDVAQGNNYTSPQKQAIKTYAYELQRYRGYNLTGENKRKEDAYNSLYEQGYDAEGADRKVVVAEYAKAKAKADKPFAGDADKILSTYKGKKPSEIEAEIKAEKSIKPEDKAMLIDYMRAKYRYDAMMQRMNDDVDVATEEISSYLDDITNKNTGTIMQVKIKGSDGLCYVVGGKLAQDVTTGEVLADVSSDMIVVLDANTGKRKAVNKLDIEQVVLNENAEKYKQTRMNEVRANNNARNEAQLKEWEAEALASAEETEAPKANDNETAPVVEAPVAERGGKRVDIEDVIAVYEFGKSDAVAARKQPEAYADIITDLEVDRQNAIAWSEGMQGAEQPDNWEYWKEREGLSEPVEGENGEKGLNGGKGENGNAPSLLDVVRTLYSKGKEAASKLFQRSFFDVAQTPKFMQELGLRGERFTIKYGVISRHIGKDSSHTLTERDWEQLPQALQNPFAISKLTDKKDSYRIYTTLQTESGEFVVVGADVKNAGRDIEINAISTVFGRRNNANLPKNEEVIYKSKEITPEQSSLLERPNFAQYPT